MSALLDTMKTAITARETQKNAELHRARTCENAMLAVCALVKIASDDFSKVGGYHDGKLVSFSDLQANHYQTKRGFAVRGPSLALAVKVGAGNSSEVMGLNYKYVGDSFTGTITVHREHPYKTEELKTFDGFTPAQDVFRMLCECLAPFLRPLPGSDLCAAPVVKTIGDAIAELPLIKLVNWEPELLQMSQSAPDAKDILAILNAADALASVCPQHSRAVLSLAQSEVITLSRLNVAAPLAPSIAEPIPCILEYSASLAQRYRLNGQVTAAGVAYDKDPAGIGASFVLLRESGTTDAMLQSSVAELRRDNDVQGSIQVATLRQLG